MARNEKKSKYSRMIYSFHNAQSTLEYAIIFPLLFFMILGIWELAFMWHQYNSLELATKEISANLALLNDPCNEKDNVRKILQSKSLILSPIDITFSTPTNSGKMFSYKTAQTFNTTPLVEAKLDCSVSDSYDVGLPILQLQTVHRLMFFSASLPNFKTGGKIVIIPDNVKLVSSKNVTVSRY